MVVMWSQVQKLIHSGEGVAANDSLPYAIPLRKARQKLDEISVGQAIHFSADCPLSPLAGNTAYVLALRHYRFGVDVLKSFQLQVGRAKHYFLTIAEDEQGQYLGLSRALSEAEQDLWFGRDALGFFMEPSTAKSIRSKADLTKDGDWSADRYSKSVDWIEGSITQAGGGRPRGFHYNLLVNESGEKALEIEHDDISGENRVFVTVYRPADDIRLIEAVTDIPDMPATSVASQAPVLAPQPVVETVAKPDIPLFREPVEEYIAPKPRPDFRRLHEPEGEAIHITRTGASTAFRDEEPVNLPAFLVARDPDYLSLDEVIPPEPERVRVGLGVARKLIDRAQSKNVRVRDVLRDLLGLDSAMSEEVIFELPLSDDDYRQLAMRYKLRPDHRDEIRGRLSEELKAKLGK